MQNRDHAELTAILELHAQYVQLRERFPEAAASFAAAINNHRPPEAIGYDANGWITPAARHPAIVAHQQAERHRQAMDANSRAIAAMNADIQAEQAERKAATKQRLADIFDHVPLDPLPNLTGPTENAFEAQSAPLHTSAPRRSHRPKAAPQFGSIAPPPMIAAAIRLLASLLANGEPMFSSDIIERGRQQGISETSLYRAKRILGVESLKPLTFQGPRRWIMPANAATTKRDLPIVGE